MLTHLEKIEPKKRLGWCQSSLPVTVNHTNPSVVMSAADVFIIDDGLWRICV